MADFILHVCTGVLLCLTVQAFIEAQRMRRDSARFRARIEEAEAELDDKLAQLHRRN